MPANTTGIKTVLFQMLLVLVSNLAIVTILAMVYSVTAWMTPSIPVSRPTGG